MNKEAMNKDAMNKNKVDKDKADEALTGEDYDLLMGLLQAGAGSGHGPGYGLAPGASAAGVELRLSRLEEQFARLCTLLGKLEQEIQALQAAAPEAAGRARPGL